MKILFSNHHYYYRPILELAKKNKRLPCSLEEFSRYLFENWYDFLILTVTDKDPKILLGYVIFEIHKDFKGEDELFLVNGYIPPKYAKRVKKVIKGFAKRAGFKRITTLMKKKDARALRRLHPEFEEEGIFLSWRLNGTL